jgi:hypothetical protein
MEPCRSVVEKAVTEMLPDANPQKPALSAAISEAAALLEYDESVLRLYRFRTTPTRIYGVGLVVVTDRALISVDSHPPDAARCHRMPANELRAVTVVPVSGGRFTGVAALSEHDKVEFFVGRRPKAEQLVEELRDLAPHAVDADPAAVVDSWWQDPRIAWPRTLSLGARWEYIGGLPEVQGPMTGLRVDLSRTGIVATESGAVEQFRICLPWDRVRAIHVEGARQVKPRLRVTSMLTVALLAGVWRKRTPSPGFLVADLNDGGRVRFASPRYTEPALRDALSTVLAAAPSEPPDESVHQ